MSSPAENVEPVQNPDDELLYSRRKRKHGDGMVAGLNLTAMMDIFTILLVYLIKVYADAPESITLNDDLRPPSSTAPENIIPSVSILISKTSILVDQKLALRVKEGGAIDTADPANAYAPLAKALIAANPRRIVWGTDWPHPDSAQVAGRSATDVAPLLQIDDGRVFNQLAVWAPDAALRKIILVENPARLYGF